MKNFYAEISISYSDKSEEEIYVGVEYYTMILQANSKKIAETKAKLEAKKMFDDEITEIYQNDINHEDLYRWVMSSPHKIYISSYKFFDLKPVLSIKHRSTLSATNNAKTVTENLYCNKPENPITLTLF